MPVGQAGNERVFIPALSVANHGATRRFVLGAASHHVRPFLHLGNEKRKGVVGKTVAACCSNGEMVVLALVLAEDDCWENEVYQSFMRTQRSPQLRSALLATGRVARQAGKQATNQSKTEFSLDADKQSNDPSFCPFLPPSASAWLLARRPPVALTSVFEVPLFPIPPIPQLLLRLQVLLLIFWGPLPPSSISHCHSYIRCDCL